MWTAEESEGYFRIFDPKKNIVGYIDPYYGIGEDDEQAQEKIDAMIRAAQTVRGGFLTVPMLKFGIFDTDYSANVRTLEGQLASIAERAGRWRAFADSWPGCQDNDVRISHTDHDMLSITFQVSFGGGVALRATDLVDAVRPMLDRLEELGLL